MVSEDVRRGAASLVSRASSQERRNCPLQSAGAGKSEKGRKDHNIVRKVKGLWQKALPQKEECGRGKGTPVARANRKLHHTSISCTRAHLQTLHGSQRHTGEKPNKCGSRVKVTERYCLDADSQLGRPTCLEKPLHSTPRHSCSPPRRCLCHDSPRMWLQATAEQQQPISCLLLPSVGHHSSQPNLLFPWNANYPGLRLVRNHFPLQLATH